MLSYNNMADVAYDITCIVDRKINEARVDLDTEEQKIIDLLILVEDKAKEYRLVNISSLAREGDRLAGKVVELVGSLCGYVEKNVHPLAADQARFEQPDEIPMQSIYIQEESLSEHILLSASLVETLAALLKVKPLDDPEVISNCIELIKNACELEKDSVTEEKWPDSEDPSGMIGCTYSQLQVYYPKKYPDIAQGFKDTFRYDADKLLDTANNILKEISGSPDIDKCFCEASQLLFDASNLVGRASRWLASQCG